MLPSRPPTMMAENSVSELSGSSGFFVSAGDCAEEAAFLASWASADTARENPISPSPIILKQNIFRSTPYGFRLLRVYEKRPRAERGLMKELCAATIWF